MLTTNLNIRVQAEELRRFEETCDTVNAEKSEVLRMLMAVANATGLSWNSETGRVQLKHTEGK